MARKNEKQCERDERKGSGLNSGPAALTLCVQLYKTASPSHNHSNTV